MLNYDDYSSYSDTQEMLLLSPRQAQIIISLIYQSSLSRFNWDDMTDTEWDETESILSDALFELGTTIS
jgi:hypothetical protein